MYVSHLVITIIMKFLIVVKVNMKKREVNLWIDVKMQEIFL